jgi:hypothetical protein
VENGVKIWMFKLMRMAISDLFMDTNGATGIVKKLTKISELIKELKPILTAAVGFCIEFFGSSGHSKSFDENVAK